MNCPSCNKFAALELQEPEITSENFDASTGEYDAEVRIVRNSECCNEEMKEATFSLNGSMTDDLVKKHTGEGHELEAEFEAETTEEGGGRYKKSYFGVSVNVTITCSCQKEGEEPVHTETMSDRVNASGMEQLW